MQFHITGRCNLKCKHCYRVEGDVEPLSFDDVINVIDQFKILRQQYNRKNNISYKGQINITGGEPFFRKDIKDIIRYLGDNKENFTYAILSNGSFIDDDIIKLLQDTHVSFVQLSIDGNRELHDYFRAPGDYDRVFKTAEYLEANGIRTYVSFTANRQNFKYITHVANECRKRKITKLWSDRLVPIGNGEEIKSLTINADDFKDYANTLKKAQGNIFTKLLHPKTRVTSNRALQFQYTDGAIYSCSAGKSLITVDEFGNIMPCRRLPLLCGNVFETTLADVYFNNDIFKNLQIDAVPKECVSCKYSYSCRGGAKCQSNALFNSFYKADPGCARLFFFDNVGVK